MRKIIKVKEPLSLAQHRRVNKTDYDGFREKQELREALVFEQRGICCYCMARIEPNELTMKIEHFLSRSEHPNERLVYNNLFGACLGNEKNDAKTHCDTFKGNKEFHFHMCTSGHIHSDIKYKNNGEIFSNYENLNLELNTVLNLNLPELIKARKSTLDGFIKAYLSSKSVKLKREVLTRFRDKWLGTSHQNLLEPYCMIVVHYLDKKLASS